MSRLALLAAAVAGLALGVAACLGTPAPSTSPPSPSPSASPSPSTVAVTASPDASRAPSAAPLPPGDALVDVPEAGIRLAVPAAWEVMDADDFADPVARADIVSRYPGIARLLEAAEQMGDRATPALVAVDPSAAGTSGSPGQSVSVLVAQPPVSGPLLDFVAGFIADGFVDEFGSSDPERSRIDTAMGEAVRLQFDIEAPDGSPMVATAYLVGATEGTLLIMVMGSPDAAPASDPDPLILGSMPIP